MVLPTNIDATYADDAGDASVKLHQQHHDEIHTFIETGASAAYQPLLDETVTVTKTVGSNQVVAGDATVTVLDITSGGAVLHGGTIYGFGPRLRLTIDGVLVINDTVFASGKDSVGDDFGVTLIPACKANTSLKIEMVNPSGSAKNFGWKVWSS